MLRTIFRESFQKISKRQYCKGTFDFFSNPVPVNTKISELSPDKKIGKNLILQLEGISLVNFGNEAGIKILEDAISYADQLEEVNTDGVEPLFTVLENESLYLRQDFIKKDVETNDLLSNSEKIIEGYYITPLGNISYVPDDAKKITPVNSENENVIDEKQKKFSKIENYSFS